MIFLRLVHILQAIWILLAGCFVFFTFEGGCLEYAAHSGEFSTGKLDHLPRCHSKQSQHSLAELADIYLPTKFTFSHSRYQRFYPRWFEEYRYRKFRMLEIGIDNGNGSLLWKEYFPCVELFGVDTNSATKDTDGGSNIQMFLGSQDDSNFLWKVVANESRQKYDIIIDDGGHHFEMQSTSYSVLFGAALNPGGIYVVEDIETSFWEKGEQLYGKKLTRGGCFDKTTFFQQMLGLARVVNRKFIDNDLSVFGNVDQWVSTITFGSNIVIIEKKDADDCPSEKIYTWPARLSHDCLARKQSSLTRKSFALAQYCRKRQLKSHSFNRQI